MRKLNAERLSIAPANLASNYQLHTAILLGEVPKAICALKLRPNLIVSHPPSHNPTANAEFVSSRSSTPWQLEI